MKKKNILFIIPEMSMGGAQRSLTKLSTALGHQYNTKIVVFNRFHEIASSHQEEILSLDVPSGLGAISKIIGFIKRVQILRKMKRKLEIDVAISFLEGADYVNILSRDKEKVIISIRGSKRYDENMLTQHFILRKAILRFLYPKADCIVCVNEGIKNEIIDYFGIKNVPVHVIHNFYDIEEIQRMANSVLPIELEEFFGVPVISMSGRLAKEKGYTFIILTFVQLRKSLPNVRLILIGDGPMRKELIELCNSVNLKIGFKNGNEPVPDVLITGETSNVFLFLKRSTLYILNSSSEGFPNGLAEAMACGIPVLSTDCPYGPGEILRDSPGTAMIRDVEFAKYGVLLPMTNQSNFEQIQSAWLDAIEQLINSETLKEKYAKRGVLRIADFSKKAMIDKWIDLIENESELDAY